jgi:hypothetical protein
MPLDVADRIPLPLPIYPEVMNGQSHLMAFNRGYFTFTIARADNGFIFEEYEMSTDTMRRKLATTPEQLRTIFDDWFKGKSEQMVGFARRMMEDTNVAR